MIAKVGLYAYGIVGKSPKQLDILGIDRENKVYLVEGSGICVCVSKIDTDNFKNEVKKLLFKLTKTAGTIPNETEAILRGHEDVVDALMKLTTVVPFKFGTVLKDKEAALKMLQDYEEKFKKLLSKFTGREEWGIKVYADSQKFKNYLMASEPKLKEQSRGIAYLLGKKMEEDLKDKVTAQLNNIAEVIFREAEKYAFEAKLTKTLPKKLTGKDKEMILNSAYLMEKEKISNFQRQIKKLREKYERAELDFEVSGPWPPYSFT